MDKNSGLIYIMGRGHSGTTILDALLGNGSGCLGVGELIPGLINFESTKCGCGELVKNCSFWSSVKSSYEDIHGENSWSSDAKIITQQASVTKFLNTLFISVKSKWFLALREKNNQIVNSILKESSRSVLIDSSKEISRALMLSKEKSTKIIHLLRSPFDIIESNTYRIKSGKGFKFMNKRYYNPNLLYLYILISSIGWTIGFFLSRIVGVVAGKNYLLISYKQLLTNPSETISQIGSKFNIDLDTVCQAISNGEELPIGHKIAGNNLIWKGSFKIEAPREKKRIHWSLRTMVFLCTFPALIFCFKKL